MHQKRIQLDSLAGFSWNTEKKEGRKDAFAGNSNDKGEQGRHVLYCL